MGTEIRGEAGPEAIVPLDLDSPAVGTAANAYLADETSPRILAR